MQTQKTLYRSCKERRLGGVCAGLATYFNVDVTIVRLAFVFLALFKGVGLLIYAALFLLMPEEPECNCC